MTGNIRQLRFRDVRQVLAIERQAFPDDPWTAVTVKGLLARATRGGESRQTTLLARLIRFLRLNEAISLAKLVRLLVLDRPSGLSYIVAEAEEGEIAGYACLNAAAGGNASIPLLAVRADCQGQKIGTALLMELIALAMEAGYRDISLLVRADNPRARRLYHRTGFTEAGILPDFYQPSGTDAVMMHLPVPASVTKIRPNLCSCETAKLNVIVDDRRGSDEISDRSER